MALSKIKSDSIDTIASTKLTGTIADARFPATLPAASGVNLTNLDARDLENALPALDASSLTSIPAGNLTGTVADARISTLTASKLSGALPAISGASLTNLDARDLENALPAISGASLTGIATGLNVSSTDGAYSSNTTGTFTVSSLGFTPKFVTCLYHNHSGNNMWSVGFATYRSGTITASQYCLYDDNGGSVDYRTAQGYIGWMSMSGGTYARLAITTWGSDSIIFTRTVSTSATSALNYKINILG